MLHQTKHMEKVILSIPEQITNAMDGRTKRWLAVEARIPETELSRKMNGRAEFTKEELERIEARLNFKIER